MNCRQLERLVANHISFALFHLPNEPEIELIVQTTPCRTFSQNFSPLNQLNGFVIAPFSLSEQTPCVVITPEIRVSGETNILQFLDSFTESLPLITERSSSIETLPEQDYAAVFQIFFSALTEQKMEKVVLSHPFVQERPSSLSLMTLFQRAYQRDDGAFTYISSTPITGLWLGATPELLLKGKTPEWQTVALAGTQLANRAHAWDEKNRQEQAYVTQYIQQQFENNNIHYIYGDPQTHQAGHLLHLKTDINFTTHTEIQIGDIIEILHPTPAVCGLPMQKALSFILQNESYARRYYTGFIGYVSDSQPCSLFVNLRCMQLLENKIILYAGGGLIPSSEQESEWREINAKIEVIQSVLVP